LRRGIGQAGASGDRHAQQEMEDLLKVL
jgi:hypothetical protein